MSYSTRAGCWGGRLELRVGGRGEKGRPVRRRGVSEQRALVAWTLSCYGSPENTAATCLLAPRCLHPIIVRANQSSGHRIVTAPKHREQVHRRVHRVACCSDPWKNRIQPFVQVYESSRIYIESRFVFAFFFGIFISFDFPICLANMIKRQSCFSCYCIGAIKLRAFIANWRFYERELRRSPRRDWYFVII